MMFDDMLEQHNIELAPEDVTFIKALIAGDPSKCRCGVVLRDLYD